MREYEMVVIFHVGEAAELPAERVERIAGLIDDHGGAVSGVYHWGLRKFAYPINKETEGFYVLLKLKMDPPDVKEFGTSMRLEREVLRYLMVHDHGGEGPVPRAATTVEE